MEVGVTTGVGGRTVSGVAVGTILAVGDGDGFSGTSVLYPMDGSVVLSACTTILQDRIVPVNKFAK